jgi:hypothetical protein
LSSSLGISFFALPPYTSLRFHQSERSLSLLRVAFTSRVPVLSR